MIQMNVPKEYWNYAVIHANLLINAYHPIAKNENKTAYEAVFKKKFEQPVYIFWSRAYSYIDSTNRKKEDERAVESRYIGNSLSHNCLKLLLPNNTVILRSMVKVVEELDNVSKFSNSKIRNLDLWDDHQFRELITPVNVVSGSYKVDKRAITEFKGVFDTDTEIYYGLIKLYGEDKEYYLHTYLMADSHNYKNFSNYMLQEEDFNKYFPLGHTVTVKTEECIITSIDPNSKRNLQVVFANCKTKDVFEKDIEEFGADKIFLSFATYATTMNSQNDDQPLGFLQPKTYDQAKKRGLTKYMDAGVLEMKQLRDLKAYAPISKKFIPNDAEILPMILLLKEKLTPTGELDRIKGRCVMLGNHESDPESGFAPTIHFISLMIVLLLIGELDLFYVILDVVGAYLRAPLKKPKYGRLPKGFIEEGTEYVIIYQSIYGLTVSGRNFYQMFKSILLSYQEKIVRKNKSDSQIYMFFDPDTNQLDAIWAVNVDNNIIGLRDIKLVERIRGHLNEHHLPTVVETDKTLLGMTIKYEKGYCMSITNATYISKLVEKYGLHEFKDETTPMDTKVYNILANNEELEKKGRIKLAENIHFPSIIAEIGWFVRHFRQDALFPTFLLARYTKQWNVGHVRLAVRILKYLHTTKNMYLHKKFTKYKSLKVHTISGYSDSDYAGDKISRKSVTGYNLFYNDNLITGVSKQQSTIASSVGHAETIAAYECAKALMFCYNVLNEIVNVELPMKMYMDNTCALKYAKFDVCSERTRHWDIALKGILELVEKGFIEPVYVPSENNNADIHTKPNGYDIYHKHREALGIY